MKRFTFTIDLEDHMPHRQDAPRYAQITNKLLEFLEQQQVKATFFVVGQLAKDNPGIIKKVANFGHEIAFHSMQHKQLSFETPETFLHGNQEGKDIIEDIIGDKIIGYRAPVFSLTQNSLWAIDILNEQGFKYSSSILPAKNPLYGFENVPKNPFQWQNGLIEIPVPTVGLGAFRVPFLGGFYLRYMPQLLVNYLCKSSGNSCLWSYVHPYDFDSTESFGRIAGASWLVSFLLWVNRKNTFKKIESIFQQFELHSMNQSFADQFNSGQFEELAVFIPDR